MAYYPMTTNKEGEIDMKNIVEAIKNELNDRFTLTENRALAYETSGHQLLDMNFKLTSYRNLDESEIENDFAKVYAENPRLAVKFMFFAGDVRGGAGERRVFRTCLHAACSGRRRSSRGPRTARPCCAR